MQIGDRFGKLTVLSMDGSFATCRCDCGEIITVTKNNLSHGDRRSCGCNRRGPQAEPLLPGTRFGKLVVMEDLGNALFLCRCDCGKTTTVYKYALTSGNTKSCGCIRKGKPIQPGTRFGNLVVVDNPGHRKVLCKCDCGKTTTVFKYNLTSGNTRSCGCARKGPIPETLLPGTRFGKLVVLEDSGNKQVLCQCDCGKTTTVIRNNLTRGHTKSCGCGKGPKEVRLQAGTRFGNLVVMEDLGNKKILCQCDCGNTTTVFKYSLTSGNTKSCGCRKCSTPIQIGTRFGNLVVLDDPVHGKVHCKCDCGNITTVFKYSLTNGNTRSCGCSRKGKPIQPGTRFGKLIVVEDRGNNQFLCKCDCGNTTTVFKYSLTSGNTRSCGCSRKGKPIQPDTRFGNLVVVEDRGYNQVLCKCDCGNTVTVFRSKLRIGQTKTCGCRIKADFEKEGEEH